MRLKHLSIALFCLYLFSACENTEGTKNPIEEQSNETTDFQYEVDQFADTKILKYQIPGFDQLSLQQKKYVYYLTQAGLAGRDIMYDQNYRHNLKIRRALENVYQNYKGDKSSDDWKNFETYLK